MVGMYGYFRVFYVLLRQGNRRTEYHYSDKRNQLLILGGAGADTITTGAGEDLILGDTGEVLFDAGLLKSIITI